MGSSLNISNGLGLGPKFQISYSHQINPSEGGGLIVPALFSDGYFSMKKGFRGLKFRDFS